MLSISVNSRVNTVRSSRKFKRLHQWVTMIFLSTSNLGAGIMVSLDDIISGFQYFFVRCIPFIEFNFTNSFKTSPLSYNSTFN